MNLSDISEHERVGKKVRMNELYKTRWKDSFEHIEEFGNSIGIVECLMDFGNSKGPEMDVRWLPNYLRYGYLPEELEVVEN